MDTALTHALEGSTQAHLSGRTSPTRTELPHETARDERWLGSPLVALAVGLAYLLLGVVVFWHWWASGHLGSTAVSGIGNPPVEIWDLRWVPYALAHGQNPFLTNRLLYPSGVNLVDQASNLLPSFILSPVTVLFGPVVAYGVAGTLAPTLSTWTAYLMIRRFTSWYPAAILGGLSFGFSPFLLGNLPYSHLNLTWLFLLPLIVVVLFELWVAQQRGRGRYGIIRTN